jgi:uncharacterized protein (TIGR03083 family)
VKVPRVEERQVSSEQRAIATEDELRAWRRAGFRDLTAAIEAAPDAALPAYPGWTSRDLAIHLVRVLSNATLSLSSGTLDRPEPLVPLEADDAPGSLVTAVRTAVDDAESALRACTAASVWTPVGPREPAFWSRRLLREAVLHLRDAQEASGDPAMPDSEVATVLVDEALDSDVTRALASTDGMAGSGPLVIRADSICWTVDPAAGAVRAGDGGASARVEGQPAAVWLWLMRREPVSGELVIDDVDGSVTSFTRMIDGFNRPSK